MSNKSKPQEWFYLQNETWDGPFNTLWLKELGERSVKHRCQKSGLDQLGLIYLMDKGGWS